jgi:hypothetical protein
MWAGLGLAGLLALYIWLIVKPSDLVLGGWIATVVAAFWLGSKMAREVAFGVIRARAVTEPADGEAAGEG